MRVYAAIVLVCVAGCKGSSTSGQDGGGGGGGMVSSAITAVATCQDAVIGFRISCDASQSSDAMGRSLTFSWQVAQQSSTGSGATFSFPPLLAGGYDVTLTATAPDGTSAVGKASATATAVPLFFRQSNLSPASDIFVAAVVGSDGIGAHALSCPVMVADGSGNGDAGAANRSSYADTPGAFGTRALYVPSQAARVVFENVTASEHQLLASDENGDCISSPPVRLDATPAAQHLVPRFSPSGARVAWVDLGSSSGQLITAGFDGTARHVVRNAAKLKTAPPVWLDDAHVAWVEDVSTSSTPHLQIASAADADGAGDGAGRSVAVDCDAASNANALQVINQFDRVGGAWIVAGGVKSRTANPPGATILYRLAGASCSTMTATTLADEPAGGFAWDFAVSPDQATLVFAGAESPGSSAHDLFLVPVDGSVQPSRFVGSSPGVDDIGPAWIAGGKQLTWTQASTDGSATGGGLMVANRDGSSVRSVLPEGGSKTAAVYVVAPTNRGLDCSAGGGGGAAGEALLLLAAIAIVRRKRA
ncbi:MAG TPA: PKD domain-containing protein [Polyangia bacterium]|nr:PKD domain-containing protein [Polyangia bacterium]